MTEEPQQAAASARAAEVPAVGSSKHVHRVVKDARGVARLLHVGKPQVTDFVAK
jgi:hypothetical protein